MNKELNLPTIDNKYIYYTLTDGNLLEVRYSMGLFSIYTQNKQKQWCRSIYHNKWAVVTKKQLSNIINKGYILGRTIFLKK